jgi:serine/threonine-protein kinase
VVSPGEEHRPRIQGYEVLGKLGAGGMGSVYAARRHGDPGLCALKVLNQSLLGREFAVRRFWKEVEVLMLQRHPGILQLRDAGHARDGRLYLATELIAGTDLFRLIQRAGPMPLPHWLELAQQFLTALDAAHGLTGPRGERLDLIHRDLKPENLMLTFDGRVVVLDFGLAQARVDGERSRITRAGQVMGTPKYMAPEQIVDPDSVSHRTDIYAAAIVLYVTAVGRTQGRDLPNGDDQAPLASMWAQMMAPEWRPLSSIAPQVPVSIDEAVFRGLALEVDDRPPSARAFLQSLLSAAGSPASGPERLGAFVSAQFRKERADFEAWLGLHEGTSTDAPATQLRPAPGADLLGPTVETAAATVASFAPTQVRGLRDSAPTRGLQAAEVPAGSAAKAASAGTGSAPERANILDPALGPTPPHPSPAAKRGTGGQPSTLGRLVRNPWLGGMGMGVLFTLAGMTAWSWWLGGGAPPAATAPASVADPKVADPRVDIRPSESSPNALRSKHSESPVANRAPAEGPASSRSIPSEGARRDAVVSPSQPRRGRARPSRQASDTPGEERRRTHSSESSGGTGLSKERVDRTKSNTSQADSTESDVELVSAPSKDLAAWRRFEARVKADLRRNGEDAAKSTLEGARHELPPEQVNCLTNYLYSGESVEKILRGCRPEGF